MFPYTVKVPAVYHIIHTHTHTHKYCPMSHVRPCMFFMSFLVKRFRGSITFIFRLMRSIV